MTTRAEQIKDIQSVMSDPSTPMGLFASAVQGLVRRGVERDSIRDLLEIVLKLTKAEA